MMNDAQRKGIRGNILFVFNIFILFLLIFETALVIPFWLQPVGRMHAMILHLPIVLILLAMVLEFFRVKVTDDSKKFYDRLTRDLLFAGVILSGITVIMGIFLAREESYDKEALFLHKWTGASVFFIASIIYSCRNLSWFSAPLAKAGAVITTLAVIFAGHLGGSLTHGESFIWEPVMEVNAVAEPVPMEEALVFEHVIKPVFEKKCVSCHNSEKGKGKLLLTDSASVMKGGKTGKLFVPGEPEESLLLKRIHLPVDDKKHMPPADRTQLTKHELALLHHWIKSGAGFSRRITELPEGDTLRMMATRVFESGDDVHDHYTFPAVAEETLEKLNSNYRVIRPVAVNSPALTVNVYNRDVYTPRTLEELKEVKLQVVSLDVAKMPVGDRELEYISRLENLRKLNLNFTSISGSRLGLLHKLEELSTLSLSGTRVNYQDLRLSLPGFKNLKTVAVWDTDIDSPEIRHLQKEFSHIQIIGESVEEGMLIRLNPPRLKNRNRVFQDSICLKLYHAVNGVDIRFTLDDSEPDSLTSSTFKGRTIIRETSAIKARAYKNGWLSSDVSTLNVYKSSLKPDTVILLTKLNRVHPANGANTFFDRQLGSFNANSPAWANNWAGFIRNDMELLLKYNSATRISSVSLNTLIETETSIFPPESVELWGGLSPDNLHLITRKKTALPTVYRKPFIQLFTYEFAEEKISCLKIIAKPVMKLPGWHKNKDKPALLLIDEILVN